MAKRKYKSPVGSRSSGSKSDVGAASGGEKAPEPCYVCSEPSSVEIAIGPFKKAVCKRCAKVGYRAVKILGMFLG